MHSFTQEQDQFRDSVRRFLERRSPTTEVRRLMDTEQGFDAEVWRRMSDELGLTGLMIPERFGGGGFSLVELGIVMEECGRVLLCAPYFSSAVLTTRTLLHCANSDQLEELLPGLAAGTRRGALALSEHRAEPGHHPGGGFDTAAIRLNVSGAENRLTGTKTLVVDGHSADFLVVAGRTGNDLGLYLCDTNTAGISRRVLPTMDATRKLAEIRFDDVPSISLGETGEAAQRALTRALEESAIALASEMIGGAQALLDSAVAYAGMRVQFGRPIGSFQAIKHKCADMLLDVESARSAACYAAQAAGAGDPETPALASLAKAAAAEAYVRTAAQTIQIHGGVGFTWENDTHLWFKRARSSEVLLGTPDYHRERMMQCWGY